MSISTREVKNKKGAYGMRTGKPGTVYDVYLKYKTLDGYKSYSKRGFLTRSEALQHEAAMRMKFARNNGNQNNLEASKQPLREFLDMWIERHGTNNLRPSTVAGYSNHINAYILPHLGEFPLCQITPALLDSFYEKLLNRPLSVGTVKYTHRVISAALSHACQYGYLETNPESRVMMKFKKNGPTPEPYNIQEMQKFLCYSANTEWEMMIFLAGLYGLRRGEITGLRWRNVDLEHNILKVVEQQPYDIDRDEVVLTEMAPPKSIGRALPITAITTLQGHGSKSSFNCAGSKSISVKRPGNNIMTTI